MNDLLVKESVYSDSRVQTEKKLEIPKMFSVMLVNDDYTPMDFVVQILRHFFYCNVEKAISVMLQVHNSGIGICGVFTKDVAETKVAQVNEFSRSHEHPLLCMMQPSL